MIVGLEASGYRLWFERMLEELGHEVWLGHPTEIRRFAKRRQKNDRRDADLILDLMARGEFPSIHRRSAESDDILRMLRYITHPGIGLLTSLAMVHTLEPIERFSNLRKVVAYAGLDPTERSSAERKRYIGISKEGSRLLRFLLGEAGQVAAPSATIA